MADSGGFRKRNSGILNFKNHHGCIYGKSEEDCCGASHALVVCNGRSVGSLSGAGAEYHDRRDRPAFERGLSGDQEGVGLSGLLCESECGRQPQGQFKGVGRRPAHGAGQALRFSRIELQYRRPDDRDYPPPSENRRGVRPPAGRIRNHGNGVRREQESGRLCFGRAEGRRAQRRFDR